MKLVRDKIPEIIEQSGKWVMCRTAHGKDELIVFLKLKMLEELDEFMMDPCVDEAADMFEVFRELIAVNGLVMEDVMYAAGRKRIERGGFSDGIILQEVGKNADEKIKKSD